MEIINKEKWIQDLLTWYRENARVLPWRSEPTPYRVWVSEIMLQQTRVEAVKPYFERFLSAVPDIPSLAVIDDDMLHKLWEGLGYYNRVRNMKKCAQVCVEKHKGKLPASYEELLNLPGIGEYTAGAVASIAFHEAVPAVDGNVLRVFSRLMVSEDDILELKTKRKFQMIIQDLMPKDHPDEFNQAVMEIGALICVPNAAPRCNICPLAEHCHGYREGKAHYLPIKKAKARRRIEKKTILILIHKHKIAVRQRPKEGLLASLYEFMAYEDHLTRNQIQEKLMQSGYVIDKMIKLTSAKHIFTHLEWHMNGYLILCEDLGKCEDFTWVSVAEMETKYAIPTALKIYRDAAVQWLKSEGDI
ncbi:A/G-specific adenine glycosylase [Clostridiaceae bacterium DONG20-135]|uniref:Adenine DNA glycosylase n=1 Tax=Copranaerobaculum intestinale TaxID=2692629 RepID=A0A6N8U6N8_9FIRM|nr:A/G-specific adenine glycosylase [Copranaerobaculum intestinale]MXQ72964.1 A/G-specific adenine glycosylase [Copranaerobaculum intestinale]